MPNRSQTFEGVNLHYAQQAVDNTARRVIFDVSGMDVASVAIQPHGNWATAVVTLKQSNNSNGPWTALSGVSTLTPAAQSTGQFSVGYAFLLADITTAEGSDIFASINFNAKGS